MCCTLLHLLIGALIVLAVENEATNITNNTELTADPVSWTNVSMNITPSMSETSGDIPDNVTSLPPLLSTNKDMGNTSDHQLDASTLSSQHLPANNDTTEGPMKNVPQSSTNKAGKTTATKEITTHAPEPVKNHGPTYIIILIIVVVGISGVVIYCCLQKKSRRYSMDLHPKQEDAHIPLSTVDAEVFDATSVKDMQTFTSVESTEAKKDPEPVKEAEKPEAGKDTVDDKQESQQNVSCTQDTVIPMVKKADELTIVDLTDGEPTISTKTSMESLDDVLNENNSNNTKAQADERPSSAFQYKMPHADVL